MKQQISSKSTFFYKIILPVFFLICAVIVPPSVYLYDRENNFVAAVFVFVFLFMSAALLFIMTKATKKVSLDDDILYISNYQKEIAVPVSNIDKIFWVDDIRPTIIYLKMPSKFGEKINFYPNLTVTSGLNPIVEELKELAKLNDE